ncbi:MAG: flagellar basal body-associated FliL family protein [Magnetococcales bacterium]|nr:flagellar basal body-associated FliL family protein [Magnetococcales bacterium]
MAEENEQEDDEGGGGLVRLLIVVLPALLIGLGGGYFVGKTMTESAVEEQIQAEPEGREEDPTEMVGEVFALDPFIVNLNEPRGSRFLKTTIQLELDHEALRPELERRRAQLRHTILSLLTSKSTRELQALEGKFQLQGEIQARVNRLLINGRIKRVYFTEFVIQ